MKIKPQITFFAAITEREITTMPDQHSKVTYSANKRKKQTRPHDDLYSDWNIRVRYCLGLLILISEPNQARPIENPITKIQNPTCAVRYFHTYSF
jgi:hypothetical protein